MTARVRAAGRAGYDAVGMYLGAWAAMREDPAQVEEFETALDETGIVVANIETLRGWASPDRADERCRGLEALTYELADRFECRYVQVIGPYTGTVAQAADGFGALCDRAGEHGLLVGIEPVPSMTNIDHMALGAEIVERADRPNGGICFDSWHLTRSTNDIADLESLDGRLVLATQWNDGTIVPEVDDYYTDTLTTRVVPGEGQFRLLEMLQALKRIGSRAPIGLEVPSTELWAAPIDVAATRSRDAMAALLAAAGS